MYNFKPAISCSGITWNHMESLLLLKAVLLHTWVLFCLWSAVNSGHQTKSGLAPVGATGSVIAL